MRWVLACLLMTALLGVGVPTDAGASPEQAAQLRPLGLLVDDYDGGWQTENDFRFRWEEPTIAEHDFPVTAVRYQVRNDRGALVVDVRWPEPVQTIRVFLPHPGIFSVSLWLEGPGGEPGPAESATLRFDSARPAPAQPTPADSWIAGGQPALLRFEHPAAPLPVSGIRGYAFSVDRGDGSAPCAGPSSCTVGETDLRAGIGGDAVSLGTLPEGLHVVRAVSVSGSGLRSEPRAATVWVDATKPEVTLSGAPTGWSNGPLRLTARATDALSGMGPSGPGGAFTALAVDEGLPTLASGDTVSAVVAGGGHHRVAFYGRDAAGNSGERTAGIATVRIDETAPRVSFANRQDPAEPERIEVEVADLLSGADSGRGAIEVRQVGSRSRFEPLPTSVSPGRLVAHWDSDAFPAGTYEFRASGYDVAGNTGTSDRRANGTRMLLVNPLKATTRTEAGFGGRHLVWNRCRSEAGRRRCRPETIRSFGERPTRRTVPYGRGVSISGRLSSGAGAPLAGTAAEIVETFDRGAVMTRRVQTIQTGTDGVFSARLAPGPSRQVEVRFAGDRLRSRSAAPALRLNVQAGVRLHASVETAAVGGPPVIFSGRVGDLDAPHPASGRPVELQFRVPGSAWSEFRTVQTDAHGRFRFPYSFSDDDSRGVRFQFRAHAPAVDGWPYEPAVSRPVFVTGR